jgi:hypothetical protein
LLKKESGYKNVAAAATSGTSAGGGGRTADRHRHRGIGNHHDDTIRRCFELARLSFLQILPSAADKPDAGQRSQCGIVHRGEGVRQGVEQLSLFHDEIRLTY